MLVDGKAIAQALLQSVQNKVFKLPKPPRLSVLTCAPNFETQKYLSLKKRKTEQVGITMNIVELPEDTTTEDMIVCVDKLSKDSDGVVVQLPLPAQIDSDKVLASIHPTKDPDGFSYEQDSDSCLSPVVGAIDEISKQHNVKWQGAEVVVLGEGRLVGKPAAAYANEKGAEVLIMNKSNFDETKLKSADILVSGMGVPHSIKASMLKSEVIVFDAGTSEDGGVLSGDVDPDVSDVASLMTPVPGGIGPITIAYLLHNVTELASR